MNVQVTYTNARYGEFEEYSSTLPEVVDCFNGENVFLNDDEVELTEKLLLNVLQTQGIAVIDNGYGRATLKPHCKKEVN